MLDAMQQLMTGGGDFDPAFLEKLYTCYDKIDPNLRLIQVHPYHEKHFKSNITTHTKL